MASEALIAGLIAAVPLVVGALLGLRIVLSDTALGVLLGFGAGTLIYAVSFELAGEALEYRVPGWLAVTFAAGALSFYLGDRALTAWTGRRRPHRGSASSEENQGPALVLGGLLDGVPEQAALGIGIAAGSGVPIALVAAIVLSNLPESFGAAAELRRSGWRDRQIVLAWSAVALLGVGATVAGAVLLDDASNGVQGGVLAYASGAILVMLADSLMPEAREKGGSVTGLATALGFALALALSLLE